MIVSLEAQPALSAFILQAGVWESIVDSGPVIKSVIGFLLAASLLSWSIVFSKWSRLRQARTANKQFLRAFRKATGLDTVAMASEQFRSAPLVSVFDFGYAEVDRQVKSRGTLTNKLSLERSLQLGMNEELSRLEQNMNWLATVATVSPFIGLLGTVWGIINAFQGLAQAGSASLRAVAPGISEALVTTAIGLAAAIPAAIFYNYFGNAIKEIGAKMEDFSLEFLNATEQRFED
jgi:biopolymer transport protein TolQ